MKTPQRIRLAALAAITGLALAAGSAKAQTPNDYIVDQFGDDTTLTSWSRAWGITPEFEWDGAENSGGVGNPVGALKITVPFDLVTLQGDNQTAFQRALSDTIDFGLYAKIHFDIKVDTNSSHLSVSWGAGQFGGIDVIARKSDWSVQLANITTSDPWLGTDAYGVWTHESLTVDPTLTNDHDMGALMMQIWSGWVEAGGVTGGHTNTVTFWIDNLYFEMNTNTAPPAPPGLSLKPALPGLQLIASQSGGQYQRQGIRTVSDQESWVGASGLVTYEMTIKDAPMKNGFQTHMFLIPNSAGDNAPDWNQPNAVFFAVTDLGKGGGSASLGFKTNQPSGNSQIFGANHLATLESTKIVGTWKLAFNHNTDITITSPDGGTTNVVMPTDAAALFAAPLTTYVGSQPNDTNYVGSGFVLSNVKITGTGAPLDDSFAGPDIDAALWAKAADSAAGVLIAPSDAKYWLSWTLPATGFVPEVNGSLAAEGWAELNATNSFKNGAQTALLLGSSVLPAGGQAYFQMIQRPFVKLQVLMPGETAAPGTASGKTGTPTAQQVGVPFDVVVNAVDATWHPAPMPYDTINITSTDGSATLPADAALVGGTKTFTVTFNSEGSYTLTATDVTDGTKTANTGAATTVTP